MIRLRVAQIRRMSTFLLVGLGLLVGQAPETPATPAGLHLLAATPTPITIGGYETEVYRLDAEQHRLSLVRKLGTLDSGVNFIVADFAGRKIVCGSPNDGPDQLNVIDMDAVRATERVDMNLSQYFDARWTPWSASVAAMMEKAGRGNPNDRHISLLPDVFSGQARNGSLVCSNTGSNKGTLLVGVALDAFPGTPLGKAEILEPGAML